MSPQTHPRRENRAGSSVELGQPALVRLDERVAQLDDIVDGQLALAVRIHHGRLIDIVLPEGAGGLDGQQLHVDVGAVERGADLRQIADVGRGNAGGVDQAGHLDHRIARQEIVPCPWGDQHEALREACHTLDVPFPIWLDKHTREWEEFGQTRFLPDDFLEPVDFQRLEIEYIDPDAKKKKSADYRNAF